MIIFFVSFSSTTPTPVCSTSSLGRTTLGTFIKWTRGTVSQRLDLTTTHTVTSPFYFKTPDIQLSGQNIVVKLPFCQQLSYWRTPQCNKINGTAGQMWPPFMTKETTLPFYSPDACRWVTYACLDVWLFFYCKPFVLCLCVDHWSWCTSALEWWKESLCTAMSHPRRCSPTGQITSPMRVFVLADSLVCWTSAAVAKVSIQVKQRVDDLVLLATAYCSCRTGVAQIYSSSLWAVKSW